MSTIYRRRIFTAVALADFACAVVMASLGHLALAAGLFFVAAIAAYVVAGSGATR